MADEYTYSDVSIYNPVTGTTTLAASPIESDIFSPTILTETYTVTEADVLAALTNNANLPASNIQVSCSGERGTIEIDSSLNSLNVYAPNLISKYYEPFISLEKTYNTSSLGIGDTLYYTWKVTNLTKTIIPSMTLTSGLNGQQSPFSLGPNEIKTFEMTYNVVEDDLYNGQVTETAEINGTSFANTSISDSDSLSVSTFSVNLKASLSYADASTTKTYGFCSSGDTVSYNATIKNTGNAPIYNISFQDSISNRTETIAKLEINESRTFTCSVQLNQTDEIVEITGTFSAEGKDGRTVSTSTSSMRYYVDKDMVLQYKVNVTTANDLKSSIPFILYNQTPTLTVDWGDGSTSTLTPADFSTASDPANSVHLYANEGTYTITVKSSNWNDTYISSYGSTLTSSGTPSGAAYAHIKYFRLTLTEMLRELPALKGTCYYYSSRIYLVSDKIGNPFESCTKLTRIPGNLFCNITSFISFYYCFGYCSSLQSIPANLFKDCVNATSFSYCFYKCSSLLSIPAGLFDYAINATAFENTFNNCTALTGIPSGLFDNNPKVTSFYDCFCYCKNIASIPAGLFDNNPNVTNFYGCFYYCQTIASIPAGLFDNNPNVTSFSYCFYGCNNIASIPDGLFDNNPKVTNFSGCFYECSSLLSIPQNLFKYNPLVTNFSYCFYDCSSLGSFSIHITSGVVSSCSSFVTRKTGTTRSVYVPYNTTSYTNFRGITSNTGITIVAVMD